MKCSTLPMPTSLGRAWWMAIRPRSLTIGVIPVLVGTALAASIGKISGVTFICTFLTSSFIQIGANLINDALDFYKGADTSARLGFTRVTQSGLLDGEQVWIAGIASLFVAMIAGLPLMITGGWPISLLLVVSALLAYAYTGGPWPLSYKGASEVFSLLFFGFAAVIATFYLQSGEISEAAILAGGQMGLLSNVLLAINNLRDHVSDAAVQKRTLAVRFGVLFARWEITFLIAAPFFLSPLWVIWHNPLAALLPCCALPVGIKIIRSIWRTEPSAAYNRFFIQGALLHLTFGVLLIMGILLELL